jgi:rhodanese-related sulfurtransferase
MQEMKMPDAPRAREFFLDKVTFTTGPVEVDSMLSAGDEVVIVDVRARADFEKGHVPGAVSLPKEEWRNPKGLAKDKTNILYCYSQVCHLAAKAAVELASQGYPVMEMDGGFEAWKENKLEVETSSSRGRSPAIEPERNSLPN